MWAISSNPLDVRLKLNLGKAESSLNKHISSIKLVQFSPDSAQADCSPSTVGLHFGNLGIQFSWFNSPQLWGCGILSQMSVKANLVWLKTSADFRASCYQQLKCLCVCFWPLWTAHTVHTVHLFSSLAADFCVFGREMNNVPKCDLWSCIFVFMQHYPSFLPSSLPPSSSRHTGDPGAAVGEGLPWFWALPRGGT